MRQVGYRTNQVRDLVFARDAIFQKTVGNKKDADGSSGDGTGRSDAMAGPDVSFGYEGRLSTALAGTAANTAYHVSSPELILPGLKAVQTPIVSRSGNLERTGHRITGACTFYMPPMGYIKALDNFSDTTQFDELETYDKLIDVERIIGHIKEETITAERNASLFLTFNKGGLEADLVPGYEIDRFRIKLKVTTGAVELFKWYAGESASVDEVQLNWDFRTSAGGSGKVTFGDSVYRTVDMPLMIDGKAVVAGDTATIYVDGTAHTAVATAGGNDGIMELNKMVGASDSELQRLQVETDNANSVIDVIEGIAYKAAEWRIESIKDYRDEYMEVAAVRVRGNRTSRRRAYG